MEIPYALKAIRRNWSNPNWWPVVFNSEVVGRFHSLNRDHTESVSVLDEDWDNLLILDGCRFDLFEEMYGSEFELNGELEKRVSKGSGSPEFLRNNFRNTENDDIVYVTANPWVKKVLDDPFHYVEHVWADGWDEGEETVLPDTMIQRTRSLMERFPNKRFIIHFMQPHHPFIGDTRLEDDTGFVGAIAKSTGKEVPDVEFVWERLRAGKIDKNTVWEAYADNLRHVIDEIKPFLEEVDGKSIITSDHGNAFGERAKPFPTRVYGHGSRIRIPPLIDVPWFVHEYDRRRYVDATDSSEEKPAQGVENSAIEDRLTALGYK